MIMKFSCIPFLTIIFLLGLNACDRQSTRSKELEEQFDRLSKTVGDTLKQSSTDSLTELKKLRQLEYKVVRFKTNTSDSSLQDALSKLGAERWDCFHVEKSTTEDGDEYRIFCKRAPETPLMYVPRGLINTL